MDYTSLCDEADEMILFCQEYIWCSQIDLNTAKLQSYVDTQANRETYFQGTVALLHAYSKLLRSICMHKTS